MRLQGKVVLVTGAASGIGRTAAEAMAREGAQVIATDIDADGLHGTALAILKDGGAVETHAHDVTSEADWARVMAAIRDAHGRLDVLVNNAGIGIGVLIADMDLARWNRQLAVNLTGPFLGTKAAIPLMAAQGGSIINLSSVAGIEGAPGLAGYCATKGGIRLFTKAAAKELAPMRIRVNSVHPGIIDTPIWVKIDQGGMEATRAAVGTPEGANAISPDAVAAAGSVMGRAGRPEEIAAGIVFLASDESSYMTGSELVIDGGWTA